MPVHIMPRLFKDPFTQWLEARGTALEVYQPGGIFGAPPVGWTFTVGRSRIIYVVRAEDPSTLVVVLFERIGGRNGLGSPFADFVRFVSLVKNSGTGIARIQGRVEASERRPEDSIETVRMEGFYHRYLGGKDVTEGEKVKWVVGELENLTMPLASERKERSTPD